jgi:hypothetical protein
MDSRVQKAMEVEALKALADSVAKSAVLLEDVVARLERIEAKLDAPGKAPSTPAAKGGR